MLQSVYRTVLFYGVLILVIRLMGKRQLGQMEPSEFVVTMLVANLASIPLEELQLPLRTGLVPIFTVLILEVLLSWLSLKSLFLREFLCGKPVILVENGSILQKNLRKARITLDELTSKLREKDVLDIRVVQYAILETGGNLSVFPYPKEKPASAKEAGIQVKKQYLPLTIISDGRVLEDNLRLAGKDRLWLSKVLAQKNSTAEKTWLLTVDGANHILFCEKE
ncbi:MAG: DUF421 domain-containing protein [Oscillospiraceae bacterium]|nr:DUF421 domain-containing protein [Oscillospiraceae bacterium]